MAVAPITVVMDGQRTVIAITDQSGNALLVYMDGDLRTLVTQPFTVVGRTKKTFHFDMGSSTSQAILVTALIEGEPAARSALTLTPAGVTVTLADAPMSIAISETQQLGATYAPISTTAKSASWSALPFGWDATWKAALAASASTPAHVMFLGDSVIQGSNGSAPFTTGFVPQLRTALIAKYGLNGDFRSAYSFIPSAGFANPAGTTPYSAITSGVYHETGLGRAVTSTSTASWFLTYTQDYAGTGFDIVFHDYLAGTWQFDIDGGLGGSPTVTVNGSGASVAVTSTTYTVTNAGTGNVANSALRKVSVRGLASSAHVIRVGQQSLSSVLHLAGFNTYTGSTGGVFFSHIGLNGAAGCDWTTARGTTNGAGGKISSPTDKVSLISGQYSTGNVSPNGLAVAPFGLPCAPHLLVLEYGLNDAAQGFAVSSYKSVMRRFTQAVRRGQDAASVLFLMPSYSGDQVADNVVAGRGYLYPRYKYAAREVAQAFSAGYVDIDAKWGELGVTKAFQVATNLHPNDAGHTDIYNALSPLVVV